MPNVIGFVALMAVLSCGLSACKTNGSTGQGAGGAGGTDSANGGGSAGGSTGGAGGAQGGAGGEAPAAGGSAGVMARGGDNGKGGSLAGGNGALGGGAGPGGVGGGGSAGSGGVTSARTVGCNIGSGGLFPPPPGPQVSCSSTDVPPTDPAALDLFKSILPNLHADLIRAMGQYACGDLPIYRGTFSASDNSDGASLASDPVVASLETDTTSSLAPVACSQSGVASRALVIKSAAQATGIVLLQSLTASDNSTYVSLVGTQNLPWYGDSASCTGCLPDLRGALPMTIDLAPTTFHAASCATPQTTAVMASGHLDRIAAPSANDVATMAQSVGNYGPALMFTVEGGDLVARIDGELWHEVGLANVPCEPRYHSKYHLEWYVNLQDIRIFGLRNFVIDQQDVYCCEGVTI